MKTDASAFSASRRALLCSALLFTSVGSSQAFGAESKLSVLRDAPLSLPRLAAKAQEIGVKAIKHEAFEVLDLASSEHAKQKSRKGADYLEIEPGAQWERNLRRQGPGANYVTFTLNASVGSIIDVAGASISVEPSQQDGSYAAIRANVSDAGNEIHYEVPLMLYDGARMAPLNIVTVKIDRKKQSWAMWFRDTPVAADIPLDTQGGSAPKVRIAAGPRGAWLCGLVCSDENPLFEDANNNEVPDDFERTVLGNLMDETASAPSLAALRAAWQEVKMSLPPSEFLLTTAQPDSFPDWCAPDGAPVHGMPYGLKFGAKKTN
jgi:hypothetical protein